MFDRIVVAFDGSCESLAALQWAAGESELRGAELDAVACVATPPLLPLWPAGEILAYDIEDVSVAVEATLARELDSLAADHPRLRSSARVVRGHAADVLEATSSTSDLVVLGAAGMHRLSAALLGSTARDVARTSECPLVLVPRTLRTAKNGRIVVGIDGTEISEGALRWAREEAERHDAELVVVHISSGPLHRSSALRSAIERADLVVVPTLRHGRLFDLVFGTIADPLVGAAGVPTVLVPRVTARQPATASQSATSGSGISGSPSLARTIEAASVNSG